MFSLFEVLLICANSFLIIFLAGVRWGVMLSSGSSVVGDPSSFCAAEASWCMDMPLVVGVVCVVVSTTDISKKLDE
jgi:hypothetical protein